MLDVGCVMRADRARQPATKFPARPLAQRGVAGGFVGGRVVASRKVATSISTWRGSNGLGNQAGLLDLAKYAKQN